MEPQVNAERGTTMNAELGTQNAEDKAWNAEEQNLESEAENEGLGVQEQTATRRDDLRDRTKAFALRVIKLVDSLPETSVGKVIRNQLLRCGTSVGANYRAAKRAKSAADFISKMGTVEEEADEAMYWMELIVETRMLKEDRIVDLYREADEILAMVVASIKTAKGRK